MADWAACCAIGIAKLRGLEEVTPDELLLGCLQAVSQYGVVDLGLWTFDLETFGVDWLQTPDRSRGRVVYSDTTVEILDRAARIAKADNGARLGVHHLLAAFASEEAGLMGELKRAHGITSGSWRAAISRLAGSGDAPEEPGRTGNSPAQGGREYYTPEEAAAALGIHVQTMRAYIRTGRLPAYRIAGERAIRIRRNDLERILEPLVPEKEKAEREGD